MKRTGFKRVPPSLRVSDPDRVRATPTPTAAFRAPVPVADVGIARLKNETRGRGVLEQLHKARLVELGCMCCRMTFQPITPDVELHHLRAGRGWGKGDWTTLMPLCWFHHQGPLGVHGLGTKALPKHYGFTEQDMLNNALRLLNITPLGQLEAP
jgi:hypothetical protein